MKFLSRASLFFLFGLYLLLVPAFAAERPYYQGKNITFFINFSAGGPTDIEGRIVARHLARHIPGNPTIVVQNMSGGGGVTGINFLGEVAKHDGLTLGYFTGPYNHQMMKSSTLRVDLMKVPFIASVQGVTVCYIRSDVAPGIKKPTDIAKAERFRAGGLSFDSNKDLRFRLACSASSTITLRDTTAATTRGSRCSATRFSTTMKISQAIAAPSSRNWSRQESSHRSIITMSSSRMGRWERVLISPS